MNGQNRFNVFSNRFDKVDVGKSEDRQIMLYRKNLIRELQSLVDESIVSPSTTIEDAINKLKESIKEWKMKNPDYELSPRQKLFVKWANLQDTENEVYYTYSGRGMFGRQCPAINLDHIPLNLPKHISYDNMGKGYVIYCSN